MQPADWIEAYGRAWREADPDGAAALFTEAAVYRSSPFREPSLGRSGVREYWERATRTQQGVEVRCGDAIVDGRRVAVEWWTTLADEREEYTLPGCLVLRFTADGLCEELREYWHLEPGRTEPPPGWGVLGRGSGGPGPSRDEWIAEYGRCWREHDPEGTAALFTADAVYRSSPFRAPFVGREAIRDYARRAEASQEAVEVVFGRPVASGSAAAVEWWTTLSEEGEEHTLPGCLVLRFEPGGLCEELREYWHLGPGRREPPPGWGL